MKGWSGRTTPCSSFSLDAEEDPDEDEEMLRSQEAWGVALLAMSEADAAEWKPWVLVLGGGTTTACGCAGA